MCLWRLLTSLCCVAVAVLTVVALGLHFGAGPPSHSHHHHDVSLARLWNQTKHEYQHVVHVAHAANALRHAVKSDSTSSSPSAEHEGGPGEESTSFQRR